MKLNNMEKIELKKTDFIKKIEDFKLKEFYSTEIEGWESDYDSLVFSILNTDEKKNLSFLLNSFQSDLELQRDLDKKDVSVINNFITDFESALNAESFNDFNSLMSQYFDTNKIFDGIYYILKEKVNKNYIEAKEKKEIINNIESQVSSSVSKVNWLFGKLSSITKEAVSKTNNIQKGLDTLPWNLDVYLTRSQNLIKKIENFTDKIDENEFDWWKYWVSFIDLKSKTSKILGSQNILNETINNAKTYDVTKKIEDFIWDSSVNPDTISWNTFKNTYWKVSELFDEVEKILDGYKDWLREKEVNLDKISEWIVIMWAIYAYLYIESEIDNKYKNVFNNVEKSLREIMRALSEMKNVSIDADAILEKFLEKVNFNNFVANFNLEDISKKTDDILKDIENNSVESDFDNIMLEMWLWNSQKQLN